MISKKHKFIFIHIPRTAGSSMEAVFKKKSGAKCPGKKISKANRNFLAKNKDTLSLSKESEKNARADLVRLKMLVSNPKCHYILNDYKVALPSENFEEYFKFGFIRNPWDRLVSIYSNHNGKNPKIFRGIIKGIDKICDTTIPDSELKKEMKVLLNCGAFMNRWKPNGNIEKIRSVIQLVATNLDPMYYLTDVDDVMIADFVGKFENLEEDFAYVCEKIKQPGLRLPKINKSKHKKYTEYYDDETQEIVAKLCKKTIEKFDYKFGD